MRFLSAILVTIVSTGALHVEASITKQRLAEKLDRYLALSQEGQDEFGFVGTKCDGLLFTSLYAISGGDADPLAAESVDEPGRFYRHPSYSCFPDESKSTISRDMLLGLALFLWNSESLEATKRLLKYGARHNWIMGEAVDWQTTLARCRMSPSLRGTFYELRYQLGGKDNWLRHTPMVWDSSLKGYRRHLQTLHIFLRYQMKGKLTRQEERLIADAAEREPANALYQAIARITREESMEPVAEQLLQTDLFPADALPTSANYCTHYLWQRDQDTDNWQPCPEAGEVHDGVDFILAAHLALTHWR